MSEEHANDPGPPTLRGPKKIPQRPLWMLAAVIVLLGVLCSWWYAERSKAPPQHPETQLFRAIAEPRVLLADVFRSYDAEHVIFDQLVAAGLKVDRRELKKPPSVRYPPRNAVTLTAAGYTHLGVTGTLTLEFFNDRLMEADFRPDNVAVYAPRLHRQYPDLHRDSTGYAEWKQPPLRIWASVDLAKSRVGSYLRTDGVVLWQDLRLIAQRDDWDQRFGAIPIPPTPR